jgi:hypothetical protein
MKQYQLIKMDGIVYSIVSKENNTYLLWSKDRTVRIPAYFINHGDTRKALNIIVMPYINT